MTPSKLVKELGFNADVHGFTFLALDLAHSIALGTPFAGRKVSQGAVLYVALEGQSTLARRFLAARMRRGHPGRMLARLKASGGSDQQLKYADKIITAARKQSQAAGSPVRLIIIDTLAQALAGENENDAAVMTSAAGHARRIAEESGATVLFVHHQGKDRQRGLRGSSALFAAADTVVAIEQRDAAFRTVRLEKSRDGATGEVGHFQLGIVEVGEDPEGNPITSCIVNWIDRTPQQLQRPNSVSGKALSELERLINIGVGRRLEGGNGLPDGAIVVSVDEWRAACRQRRLSEGGVEGERKAFQRAQQICYAQS